MLYDNGQFLRIYAEAAVALKRPRYAEVAAMLVAYLEREMRHDGGAFYSSQDADSGGEEGTYYVWTPKQVRGLLKPEQARAVEQTFAISEQGNFEHKATVLTRPRGAAERPVIAVSRDKMLEARSHRVAPPTDTKRVVAYNGLMIGGLARSGRLLDRPHDIELAQGAAKAVLASRYSDGGLPRTLEPGSPSGVLDDYALFIEALLDLYEADFDLNWLIAADSIATVMIDRFWDPVSGGFFYSDPKGNELLVRQKEVGDGARPSGYGRALATLVRLEAYGASSASSQTLQEGLDGAGRYLARSPASVPTLLTVLGGLRRPAMQVVIATPPGAEDSASAFIDEYNSTYRPHDVLARVSGKPGEDKFDAFRSKAEDVVETTAYVCFDGVCKQPVSELDSFRAAMASRPNQ
jgi:uncharacterized protein YyaL (SSP411 family)